MLNIYVNTWGNYNENGANGGEWITLPMDPEELKKEMDQIAKNIGDFSPEFFINDYEFLGDLEFNINENENIENLNNLISDIDLLDIYDQPKLCAISECYTSDIKEALDVLNDYDTYFYENMTLLDVAYWIVEECYNLPEFAERYFDYEAFARDLSFDGFYETSYGVIEIR